MIKRITNKKEQGNLKYKKLLKKLIQLLIGKGIITEEDLNG